MNHARALKFTFFRHFWTRCFLPVPQFQKCPQDKLLSVLLKKILGPVRAVLHACCMENYTFSRPLICNLRANRILLTILQARGGQFNLCPSPVVWMSWEAGDGEGRMEIAQPWLAGRVPGNAGCPLLVHMGSRFPPCLVHLLEPIFPPVNTLWLWSKGRRLLTICCHANVDAFFKATFLALISGDFVYDTFSFIFTGIGWMEIFLNGSSKETLCEKERPKTTVSYFLEINDSSILSLPKCFF